MGGGLSGDPNLLLVISSSSVKIRLHTQTQIPRLPGRALKVCGWCGGGVGTYPLSLPNCVEVELGYDHLAFLFR